MQSRLDGSIQPMSSTGGRSHIPSSGSGARSPSGSRIESRFLSTPHPTRITKALMVPLKAMANISAVETRRSSGRG